MRLQLRDYQADALTRTAEAHQRGVLRQLGVAATGLGKTVMFASVAERMAGRALVVAHRDELIAQAVAKLCEVWGNLRLTHAAQDALLALGRQDLVTAALDNAGPVVGVVKAGADDVAAELVVASVQTLARQRRLERLVEATTSPLGPGPFALVVVDEAHHSAADTYRALLDALRAGQPAEPCPDPARHASVYDPHHQCGAPAGPLLLGVTATPDRGDGKGLDDLYDEVVWSYDILWGIRSGYLADVRGRRVRLADFDLGEVRVRQGDYDQGQAGRMLEQAGAPTMIVRAWQAEAVGRPTLVFTPTVAMAEAVAAEFVGAGVRAAMVHGGTPPEERRATLRAFSSGEVQVVANCAVLTEGYDEPSVSCIVVALPTRSRALYTQMVGRGTRRHPDKDHLLVLDVVGATDEHSLVTVPSLFGVENPTDWEANGKPLSAQLADEAAEAVRLGRLRAEDVELFGMVRAAGIAWVQVHAEGDHLRRYHRPLGKDRNTNEQRPTVVLAQREADADVWTAGLWWERDNRKQVLMANVTLELAQGIGEDYVRKHGGALGQADAPWRARKPTAKAKKLAHRWRLPDAASYKTAGELSDALDAHIARRKAARAAKQ